MAPSNPLLSGAFPSLSTTIVAAGGFYILYYLATAIYNVYFHPLAKFPGPKSAAISRLPAILAHFQGRLYKHLDELHAAYGPIVRIAPNELTTTLSEAWREIYQRRPECPKDPFSQTKPLSGVDSLFTADAETHLRVRRTFVNGFSDKALREQAPLVECLISRFMSRLQRETAVSVNREVDIQQFFGYVWLDILGDLVLGESFHSLEGDNGNAWVRTFAQGTKFGTLRASLSRLYPLDYIVGAIGLRLTSKTRQRNMKYMLDKITRRLEMGHLGTGRSDFITPVIGNIDSKKKNGITRDELDATAGATLLAGTGLPHASLTATIYFLLRNPETMKRLIHEVRTAFDSEEQITIDSTQNLLYLEAVTTESLRIFHPTPSQLPRVIPPGGLVLDGQFIPGGTVVGVALHSMHNSPSNWVEPRMYHPERWLPESHQYYDSRFKGDDKEAYKPFSTGNRNCLGWRLFLASARTILGRLIWRFDIEAVDKDNKDWPDHKAYLVVEIKPLLVRLRERGRR